MLPHYGFNLTLAPGNNGPALRQIPRYCVSDLDDLLSVNKQEVSRGMSKLDRCIATAGRFQAWSAEDFWEKAADTLLETLRKEGSWLQSKIGVPLETVTEAVRTPQNHERRTFFLRRLNTMHKQALEMQYVKLQFGRPADIQFSQEQQYRRRCCEVASWEWALELVMYCTKYHTVECEKLVDQYMGVNRKLEQASPEV